MTAPTGSVVVAVVLVVPLIQVIPVIAFVLLIAIGSIVLIISSIVPVIPVIPVIPLVPVIPVVPTVVIAVVIPNDNAVLPVGGLRSVRSPVTGESQSGTAESQRRRHRGYDPDTLLVTQDLPLSVASRADTHKTPGRI
ncbi:hypothetical protein ACOQFL_21605 [Actinopolyspora sp. H202]|uniref:hypothetical protein n=1 Tax=Actinopolyspora sp. H202 TaxID=1500456 RepID=UPI003EE4FA12